LAGHARKERLRRALEAIAADRAHEGFVMPIVLEDEADFVVVGTGAGGATAARVLSEAGFELALVEEGAFLRPEDRPRELLDAMALAVRGMATMATDSVVPMPLLTGRCVGGSTAINS